MSQIEFDDKLIKTVIKILILNKDTSYTKEELYNTLLIEKKDISINKKEFDKIFEKIDKYNEYIDRIYIDNKECLIWKSNNNKKIDDKYINDLKNKKIKVNDYINRSDNIIHYLTKKEDIESLKDLEKQELNIDWMKKNKEGKTCLDLSKEVKNIEIYDFFNEKRNKKKEEYNQKKYLLFFILGVLCMMDTTLKRYINNQINTYNTSIYERIMYNNTTNLILSIIRNTFHLFIRISRYVLDIEIVNNILLSIYF
jgi:hypothetical protein